MNYHEAARFIEQMDALCEPHKEEVNREVFLVQRAYDAGRKAGLEEYVWTDQRPTKPGFYWWRDKNFPLSGERRVIELEWDDLDPQKWEGRWGNTCEWSSNPIAEPQEQRP